MPNFHELKCWPSDFMAVAHAEKLVEIRLNDRNYRQGDILALRCYVPTRDEWAARYDERQFPYVNEDFDLPPGYDLRREPFIVKVKHIYDGPGLEKGYVALSIVPWGE